MTGLYRITLKGSEVSKGRQVVPEADSWEPHSVVAHDHWVIWMHLWLLNTSWTHQRGRQGSKSLIQGNVEVPDWQFYVRDTLILAELHEVSCQSFTHLTLCQSIACKQGDACLNRISKGKINQIRHALAHLIVGLCLADTCKQSSIKATMSWGASSGALTGRNWPLMGISPVQISHISTPAEVLSVLTWQNPML